MPLPLRWPDRRAEEAPGAGSETLWQLKLVAWAELQPRSPGRARTVHPAGPSRSRALPRTEGPGEGVQRALHKRTWSLQQPDPRTGTSTSFEGKVTEQKCDHHLVHAPLPCPVPAALLFLPACLPSQPPPFSFSLLIYFRPSRRGIWVTSASRSLRAKALKLSKYVQAGGCKGGLIYFLFKVFSKGYFQHPIPTTLPVRSGQPGASRRAAAAAPLSAAPTQHAHHTAGSEEQCHRPLPSSLSYCSPVVLPCTLLLYLKRDSDPASRAPAAPTCTSTTLMLLQTWVALPQRKKPLPEPPDVRSKVNFKIYLQAAALSLESLRHHFSISLFPAFLFFI